MNLLDVCHILAFLKRRCRFWLYSFVFSKDGQQTMDVPPCTDFKLAFLVEKWNKCKPGGENKVVRCIRRQTQWNPTNIWLMRDQRREALRTRCPHRRYGIHFCLALQFGRYSAHTFLDFFRARKTKSIGVPVFGNKKRPLLGLSCICCRFEDWYREKFPHRQAWLESKAARD